jgi:GNAT superfamily N-acetyltransferase
VKIDVAPGAMRGDRSIAGQVTTRSLDPADIETVGSLLAELASAYILAGLEREAREGFLVKNGAAAIREFIASGFRYHVAEMDGRIVGFVGVRGNTHLYHLFVAAPLQRRGIGRRLWEVAKHECEAAGQRGPFTVNASDNAVPVYERWGFRRAGPPRSSNGIVYNPMELRTLSALLPGSWLLESRIDRAASGEPHPDPLLGEDPVALLVYDRSGHFSAQFMKRDRSASPPEAGGGAANNTRAQGGYDAYFGTYTVDDASGTVTQRLLGSLSPGNVGMVLTRGMEVRDNTLVIRLETTAVDAVPVTRTLTWRRLGDAA